jgi:hypothetical protein
MMKKLRLRRDHFLLLQRNKNKKKHAGNKHHPHHDHHHHTDPEHHFVPTEVGTVVHAFAPLLHDHHHIHLQQHDVDIPLLLQACKTFHTQMERVGQAQSARDLSANIRKVELLYETAPADQRDTLTSLLQFEKSLNIHPLNGILHDPSGAIGLLWIRRSIAFQTCWYQKLLADPDADVTEAAKEAYRSNLQPFHGYLLQNIFLKVGIPAMTPPRNQLLARLGGFAEETMTLIQKQSIQRDLQRLVHVWDPLVTRMTSIMEELDMEDRRRI